MIMMTIVLSGGRAVGAGVVGGLGDTSDWLHDGASVPTESTLQLSAE